MFFASEESKKQGNFWGYLCTFYHSLKDWALKVKGNRTNYWAFPAVCEYSSIALCSDYEISVLEFIK